MHTVFFTSHFFVMIISLNIYFIVDIISMFFYVLYLELWCSGNDLIHYILKVGLIYG